MGEHRGPDDSGIGDLDPVVHFVTLLQAPQDRDGVFDGGLLYHDFLETPLQRGVLLEVQTILVQRRRSHAVEFTARQRRLQHVACIHGTFGLSRAHDGVQLVDEQDDLAFLLGQLVQHRLEPLFKLAAEFRTGNQRAHVERQYALRLQTLRHLAVDDALCQALDDRRLADTGLADQHRVILRAPLQDLNRAPDLVVPADDRIELTLLGALREIDRVFVERLASVLGVWVVDLRAAANVVDCFFECTFDRAGGFERTADIAAILESRKNEQLA